MRRTNSYLDDDQCVALDELAAERGTSRAAVIRQLLDDGLAGARPSVGDDLAALDASFGGAPEITVSTRGDDDRARHLRRGAGAGT